MKKQKFVAIKVWSLNPIFLIENEVYEEKENYHCVVESSTANCFGMSLILIIA